jgi:hypothetical protein
VGLGLGSGSELTNSGTSTALPELNPASQLLNSLIIVFTSPTNFSF